MLLRGGWPGLCAEYYLTQLWQTQTQHSPGCNSQRETYLTQVTNTSDSVKLYTHRSEVSSAANSTRAVLSLQLRGQPESAVWEAEPKGPGMLPWQGGKEEKQPQADRLVSGTKQVGIRKSEQEWVLESWESNRWSGNKGETRESLSGRIMSVARRVIGGADREAEGWTRCTQWR